VESIPLVLPLLRPQGRQRSSSGDAVKTCRSCQAEVIWAKTEFGAMAPFDAAASEKGTFRLEEGKPPRAYFVEPKERPWRGPLHVNHFATCPDRNVWRHSARLQ
jgi:hypothetical protein